MHARLEKVRWSLGGNDPRRQCGTSSISIYPALWPQANPGSGGGHTCPGFWFVKSHVWRLFESDTLSVNQLLCPDVG